MFTSISACAHDQLSCVMILAYLPASITARIRKLQYDLVSSIKMILLLGFFICRSITLIQLWVGYHCYYTNLWWSDCYNNDNPQEQWDLSGFYPNNLMCITICSSKLTADNHFITVLVSIPLRAKDLDCFSVSKGQWERQMHEMLKLALFSIKMCSDKPITRLPCQKNHLILHLYHCCKYVNVISHMIAVCKDSSHVPVFQSERISTNMQKGPLLYF